ncbi:single-stranded-DNA-specific exonuclease RecJ [soil metagenome]
MTGNLSPPAPRWVFPEAVDELSVDLLRSELRLPEALCRLLVRRSHSKPEQAKEFLRPHAGQIHSPGALAGIEDAVERLRGAIVARETILVHGDYDVDGICTTALYVRALRAMGARVEAFVPDRLRDGYDLTEAGVAIAVRCGAGLILTGDCGIVAHGAVEAARRSGIDVIVTDHHTPGDTLPAAVAVINPNRSDCGYPDKSLAGVGVAYKVCFALAEAVGYPAERMIGYLDLVAVATVADLAPLKAENRALVRWGLRVLQQTRNPGLAALLRSCGLADRGEITAGQVGFILAPRLNAVGRMGDALRGVRLLLTDDEDEANRIAAVLEEENRWRREVDQQTFREAMKLLERGFDPAIDRGVVLASAGWHPGVIGIVASRVVERVHRPTVMIAVGDREGKGSARSIPGFNLFEAIRDCSEHLTRFGGHRMAAGCSIAPDRIDGFRAAFQARASAMEEILLTPELRIDVELNLAEANAEMHRLLKYAAPFGMGNPSPVLAARKVRATSLRRVGSDHLKMSLSQGSSRLEAIGFGMADRLTEIESFSGDLDVAFKLEENSWQGRISLQARVLDVRRTG